MSEEYKSVKEFPNLIKFEEVGQSIEGIYLGSYDYESKTKKDKEGKPKVFTVHKFDQVTPEGKKEVQFFGAGQLDSELAKVAVGTQTKIVYEGMKQYKHPEFGDTEGHQFDVLTK